MKYVIDHDLHIHSHLSSCSDDPEQTKERILQHAKDEGLKTICVTDHFWDETLDCELEWYQKQNYEHISASLPLPKNDGVDFLFGCETELNKYMTLGISKERFDSFDFIIIPTTHFHIRWFTLFAEDVVTPQDRANTWVKRLDAVLNMDLPFHKVGLAHLTCSCISPIREDYLKALDLIPRDEMLRLFTKAKELVVGIELNSYDMNYPDSEEDTILRIYKTVKECGCKFYLGSDAHHPDTLVDSIAIFQKAIDALQLQEEDKYIIPKLR
jgi:histidinol phosphatase-like PHP family hydrolase